MAGDYRYFIVRTEDGRVAAASSAEIYREDENVEMTGFAVVQTSSYPVHAMFSRVGPLVNNTSIRGGFESVNIRFR
ncbi:MAG: hypothetical protein ACOX0O_08385 [Candidatus Methanoculleus thermohydrogenotrophicum]|jgi:hypothetical protein|nr:hypothetical protein [Candidatus Methanoculleus thermohydrogenotrophicum]